MRTTSRSMHVISLSKRAVVLELINLQYIGAFNTFSDLNVLVPKRQTVHIMHILGTCYLIKCRYLHIKLKLFRSFI